MAGRFTEDSLDSSFPFCPRAVFSCESKPGSMRVSSSNPQNRKASLICLIEGGLKVFFRIVRSE